MSCWPRPTAEASSPSTSPPLILGNVITVAPTTAPTTPGSPPIVTGPITFSGSSEISSFGNTTWITVEDVTDPANPRVIAGFNPATGVPLPSASNSTNAQGNFSINFDPASVYTSNGVRTIEVFATDAAGSVGNKVTYSFTLNDPNLPQPPPNAPPTFTQNLAMSPSDIKGFIGNVPVTNNLTPAFIGVTNIGVTLTVSEFIQQGDGSYIPYGSMFTTTSNPNSGSFTFPFSNPSSLSTGTFQVFVTAVYTNFPDVGSSQSDTVTFQINNETPAPVTDLRLNPADDTGIVGDSVTSDRTPHFIGTAPAGDTIELFQSLPFTGTLMLGSSAVTGITSTTGLAIGQSITGNGIPSKTTILSVQNATATTPGSITLSMAATLSGSQNLIATVPVVQGTTTASTTTSTDSQGHPYNFSLQLPFALSNGSISLNVIVIDAFSGNPSAASNLVTLSIISVASDYNGDGVSDPALFNRNATTNQLQWLVQSTVLPPATTAPPPWFTQPVVFTGTLSNGSASVTGISSTAKLIAGQVVTGTGIPSGTTIVTVSSTTAITLSANATVSDYRKPHRQHPS